MDIEVRPLAESDLDTADLIFRDAFGTFLGTDMFGDTDLVRTRFRADHVVALGAYADGELIGSNLVTRWGSVAYFGPLSVTPRLWDRGVGARLVDATLGVFAEWGVTHQGLFTFAHSPRHHWLYQKFGFWPRFLTAIMSREVTGVPAARTAWTRLTEMPDRAAVVAACGELTGAILPGLDVRGEIDAVIDQKLGDVLLLGDDPVAPHALAVCHAGAGSEAGSGFCYVKFAAVRPGRDAGAHFSGLLDACQAYAAGTGAQHLALGVNTARHEAYRHLVASGFRTDVPGVTMHRPNVEGYDRAGVYLIDDWR
ncbi:GNAT family N-acetyltransferase [Pseudonocardia bannensis]|uniref:GNAT family N-acetyltransferase n=1 Tax=Pseudonocardia bannensis TaxID=630973 RepID=A0A848DGA4_9PSEU|nr:GNAT family N-acetyltransferase [Pseudonocardia bannensis]NMH91688.1 GNAT family N-acetyltransferase [Pseudonocardia bannensis]